MGKVAKQSELCDKKMKLTLITVLLGILFILPSCKIVSFYEYTHKPTASVMQALWDGKYSSAKSLKNRDLVIIPDFRSFTSSFPNPGSRLIVCSKKNDPFWIEKAILRVKGEDIETTLNFSKDVPYKQPIGESGYHIVWILLFDDKNTEYSKYKIKEHLELELHYAPSKNDLVKVDTFELELIKRKDFAWPT